MSTSTSGWETIIGLEIHCQLNTQAKLFCSCPVRDREIESDPIQSNSRICPVCAGHPGSLPVLNEAVPHLAVRLGLALGAEIDLESCFARKNYFYPDLPKGYQISQYERPICRGGKLRVSPELEVRLNRIHIEEDAGKSVHPEDSPKTRGSGVSRLNLNRAGVPLLEIVSEPDLRTAEAAGSYMRAMHELVVALGISDGNLQEGNFRCDANVSVRRAGEEKFGTRTEIKNVNSFKFVEKAILFEAKRQIRVLESGGTIHQETRSYDADQDCTRLMRSKEEAEDYRYFPDPDLPAIRLTPADVEEIRRTLPELPAAKRERYERVLGLSAYDAQVLTQEWKYDRIFSEVIDLAEQSGKKGAAGIAKSLCSLITGEMARLWSLRESGGKAFPAGWNAQNLFELVQLQLNATLSSSAAKKVLGVLEVEGGTPREWVKRLGLEQVSDDGALLNAINEVIAAHPQQWSEVLGGKEKVLGFLVGQVMKRMQGKANPARVQELFGEKRGSQK